MEFQHKTVLLEEAVNLLSVKPDGIYLDGTVGGAGHSRLIASRLGQGRLISLDKDPDAIAAATKRLAPYPRAIVVERDFSRFDDVLDEQGIVGVDGMLLDLGVSSHQLDRAERGFSYHQDAPLDMRMSQKGLSARDVVNGYDAESLARILREFADERYAGRIADAIVRRRESRPIERTLELAEVVASAVPASARRDGHPARKTCQAIRIAVNGELDCLSAFLDKALDRLNPDGVLAIITFHSLEDRMVKHRFAEWCTGCTCPPDFPVCVCGKKPRAELVNRKPVEPTADQVEENYRVRSAKLRAVKKL